jgi:hypothetical protein
VWSHLLSAVAKGKDNPNGYTYALANQNSPETLTVWHNGNVVLDEPGQHRHPGRPHRGRHLPRLPEVLLHLHEGHQPGRHEVRRPGVLRSYFNGGDAVHQFPRYSYGWYQSLGCVELPWDAAKTAYGYLSYGSLVTVPARWPERPEPEDTAGRLRNPGPPRWRVS